MGENLTTVSTGFWVGKLNISAFDCVCLYFTVTFLIWVGFTIGFCWKILGKVWIFRVWTSGCVMYSQMTTGSEIQALQAGSGEILCGFDEMGNQRILVVSDQANGFHCNREKSDSFVVDIEEFNHSADLNPSSRITLQRNLSRKGSLRGASDKRIGFSPTSNEREDSLLSGGSSSPKALTVGYDMPEVQTLSTADHPANLPSHHQITITTGNTGTNNAESKWINKRSYSFRHSPPSWALDPRKILVFFASLSSMGTILLIYFTLSMSKASIEDVPLE